MGKKKRLKLERAKQLAEEKKSHVPVPFWAGFGVTVFGALLILSSFVHIQKMIVEGPVYVHYYSYLSPEWIVARYAFSWFQRLVGILAGVGILARKEIGRKLALLIGIFTVLTVYWKHPYEAVKLHTEHLDQKYGYLLAWTRTGVTFSSVTSASVFFLILSDVVFWAVFIYFFTRPSVKRQFEPGA